MPSTRPISPGSDSSFSEINSPSSDAGQSNNSLPTTVPPDAAQPKELLSLTNFKGSGYAATEAIKFLLQAIGRDVVSFRRNTHVSYLVVERARDIVNSINGYIAQVESSATGDWESFEKFSSAIEPLEETLFKLLLFTEDEKTRYFGGDHDIADCITSTAAWAANRETLSETLKGFTTRGPIVNLFDGDDSESRDRERLDALSHDDLSLMGEMGNARKKIFQNKDVKFPRYVASAVAPLDALQTDMISGSLPEWLTVITIKTCMLVQGVLEVILSPSADREVLNHLKSKVVWQAVLTLTKALVNVNKGLSDLPNEVQKKFDEFLKLLQQISGIVIKLPESYVNILKEAGRVHRPFQAQAFALVMLCRFLADYFTKAENKANVNVDNTNSLEEAFNETLAVLQAAVKAVSQLSVFELTNFETNDTVKQFEMAESVIMESFKSFGLSDEWSKKASIRKEAWKKDKDRMDQLNKALAKPPSSSSATVQVNISIQDKSGRLLCNTSFSEEVTTRLLALRWTVAKALPDVEDAKNARTAGSFYKLHGNESVDLQKTVGEVREVTDINGGVYLKLVLA